MYLPVDLLSDMNQLSLLHHKMENAPFAALQVFNIGL